MVGTIWSMVLQAHDLRAFDRARNLTSRTCLFYYFIRRGLVSFRDWEIRLIALLSLSRYCRQASIGEMRISRGILFMLEALREECIAAGSS